MDISPANDPVALEDRGSTSEFGAADAVGTSSAIEVLGRGPEVSRTLDDGLGLLTERPGSIRRCSLSTAGIGSSEEGALSADIGALLGLSGGVFAALCADEGAAGAGGEP